MQAAHPTVWPGGCPGPFGYQDSEGHLGCKVMNLGPPALNMIFPRSCFALNDTRCSPPAVRRSSVDGPLNRQVDVRLPKKGNLNSHSARQVHLIITMDSDQ